MTLDIAANRRASKYSTKEQMLRVLWSGGRFVFRMIPRPLHALRRSILRVFGATIGASVNISPTAHIYFPWMLELGDSAAIGDEAFIYNLGPVKIGARATVSQRAHLCAGTHDHSDPTMLLVRSPIEIGADAWICADSFIGPGVSVGEGAVVGARAAVFKDVAPWTIVGGNPAVFLKARTIGEPVAR
jgi:putative colanic acid biosynthesis acetyltransferase WcaF